MNIAIIGAGNVGGALARSWAAKGHQVHLGLRSTGQAEWEGVENISQHLVAEAVALSEVILVALPIKAVVEVAQQLGDLSGKVLIDATNSLFAKPAPYATGYQAFKELTGAEVAKCFNSTGFENMIDPKYGDQGIDMFMAGESEQAKAVVRELALDAGFEACYDFGGENRVELLEQFALAWINLAIMQGEGRNIAFKVLHR